MMRIDLATIKGILAVLCLLVISDVDAEVECISRPRGEYENFGYEADEFEPGEYGDFNEADDMGEYGAMRPTGRLRCTSGGGEKIVVKRVAFGMNMFGRCRPDGYCNEEFDTGERLAAQCDGRRTCLVDMLQPVFLRCGRMSSYMLVEYECLKSPSTYEVCNTISTVAPGPSVSIVSPGYLTSRPPGPRRMEHACDCILQSVAGVDIYLDYLQTHMESDGDFCPYEYVRIESKSNITQSQVDQQLEVCGRRHVSQRWFKGSVRLTYASGEHAHPRGLVAKFTADNRGNSPQINVECGPTDVTNLNLKKKPSSWQRPSRRDPSPPPWGYPPPLSGPLLAPGPPPFNMRASFGSGVLPPMIGDDSPMDRGPDFLTDEVPLPGMSPFQLFQHPTPPPRSPSLNVAKWKIKLPSTKSPSAKPFTDPPSPTQPPRRVPQQPAKPSPERKATPPRKRKVPERGRGKPPGRSDKGVRRPPAKGGKKAGRISDDANDANEEEDLATEKQTNGKDGDLSLIIGGIGAVLILGCVGILVIHNYRKRQRIKREEAERAAAYVYSDGSTTYGKGWTGGDAEESVYATVAEVDQHRQQAGCTSDTKGMPSSESKQDQQTSTEKEENDNVASKLSGTTSSRLPSSAVNQIVVVDVHQLENSLDFDPTNQKSDCSQSFQSEPETTPCSADSCGVYCSRCRIVRPPRRRDGHRGYDNNVGVRKNINS